MFETIIGTIIFFILFALIDEFDTSEEDTTHHDNRKGSFYYESQKSLRDRRL